VPARRAAYWLPRAKSAQSKGEPDGEDTDQDHSAWIHGPRDHPRRLRRLGDGGGGYDWGWGSQEDDDSVATIQHALELGLNWIDTPAQYGFGHSEEVVGRVIAGLHERPYLFTKGGQPEGPARTTLQSLRRDSLRRELWTLRNPAVDGAIAGFRRRDQVDPIVAAANLELGERHRDDRRESMK
jgi:aryl-alcohol dehydrogenase-like predicted oxidoreductase